MLEEKKKRSLYVLLKIWILKRVDMTTMVIIGNKSTYIDKI
ncbi:hypothetical protein [Paraclostridium sordellii]|nr:hypothetical protein [Paeniclostridium sordellii]